MTDAVVGVGSMPALNKHQFALLDSLSNNGLLHSFVCIRPIPGDTPQDFETFTETNKAVDMLVELRLLNDVTEHYPKFKLDRDYRVLTISKEAFQIFHECDHCKNTAAKAQ